MTLVIQPLVCKGQEGDYLKTLLLHENATNWREEDTQQGSGLHLQMAGRTDAPLLAIVATTGFTARQADVSLFELLSEGYPSCQPLSPIGTAEKYYRLSLPWELACKTPMLSSNCIDLMLSDAKMHSLS